MASLRKRATSKFWVACIKRPDGTRRQFSTGLTDRSAALAVAHAAESATGRLHERPHALRASLERLADEYAIAPTEDVNPASWILQWAVGKSGEVSPGTSEAYLITAKEASRWFADQGVKSFQRLTEAHCRGLRDKWKADSSATNANKKMKHLRMALTVAMNAGLMDRNPMTAIPPLKIKTTSRRQFSDEELKVLFPALNTEWAGMAWLALNTGQRINDLAVLQWRGLDLAAKTVTFTAKKAGKLVCLPLLEKTVDALALLPSSDDPAAFVFRDIAKMARTRRSNAFREILAGVNLARPLDEKAKGKGRTTSELSFHSFRHTATTWLKSAGVSDAIARAIIGHESVAVSRSYTHFDMKTMREAMEKVGQLNI